MPVSDSLLLAAKQAHTQSHNKLTINHLFNKQQFNN